MLIQMAAGDGRALLTLLEQAAGVCTGETMTCAAIEQVVNHNPLRHDRKGTAHYDCVSAWIKSMRGSDPDAALYWGARLWEAGEDRRFLFRRLIIFASEDIGNADTSALTLATSAASGYERVGDAEGWILFAQAVTYLATAYKSNASYKAYRAAKTFIEHDGNRQVPTHLCNATDALSAQKGYGDGYQYPHDYPEGVAPSSHYFPDEAKPGERFYQPTPRGAEARIRERMNRARSIRQETGDD